MLRRFVLATLLLSSLFTATSAASQKATLQASLTPERLGHETTFGFGFQISAPPGQVPSPLVAVGLNYPKNLGVAVSGLGVDNCTLAELTAQGLRVCTENTRMGSGTASVEVPVGGRIVTESAHVDVVRAPDEEGHLAMIFDTEGLSPVLAEIALPAVLHEAPEPFGGKVAIQLPPVPSLPEASDVAVVDMHVAIGPAHLIYHEVVHGKTIAYRPEGIKMPKHCPRGGFLFTAAFEFLDGSRTSASAVVACPRHAKSLTHRSAKR